MSEPTKDEGFVEPEGFYEWWGSADIKNLPFVVKPGTLTKMVAAMAFRAGQAACGHQGATYHDGYDQGWKEAHVLSIPACHPLASSPEARAESVVMHRVLIQKRLPLPWEVCKETDTHPYEKVGDSYEHASFLRSSPGSGGKEEQDARASAEHGGEE